MNKNPEDGASSVIACYLVRDADAWAHPDARRVRSVARRHDALGLSDAQRDARERSEAGTPQVIVEIANNAETIIEEYAAGLQQ